MVGWRFANNSISSASSTIIEGLLGPPDDIPAPGDNSEVATASNILYTWDYPIQKIDSRYLLTPPINSLQIEYKITDNFVLTRVHLKNFYSGSTLGVSVSIPNPTSGFINRVIIQSAAVPLINPVQQSDDNFIYYIQDSSIRDRAANSTQLIITYGNANGYSKNKRIRTLSGRIVINPPGVPQNVNVATIVNNLTSVNYTAERPQYISTPSSISLVGVNIYDYMATAVDLSNNRVNGLTGLSPLGVSTISANSSGNSNRGTITVYPDINYILNIKCRNFFDSGSGNVYSGYSITASTTSFNTGPVPPFLNPASNLLSASDYYNPGFGYTVCALNSTNSTENIVVSDGSITIGGTIPINIQLNRGTLNGTGVQLMNLNTTIGGSPASILKYNCSLTNGADRDTTFTLPTGFTITATPGIVDQHISPEYYKGYYYKSVINNITYTPPNSSVAFSTLTLTQDFYVGTTPTKHSTSTNYSFTINYEPVTGNPNINTVPAFIYDTGSVVISGIKIVTSGTYFKFTQGTISNMGTNYYIKPAVSITATNTNNNPLGTVLSGIPGVNSPLPSSILQLGNTAKFQLSNIVSYSFVSTNIIISFKNVKGTSSTTTLGLNAILDPKSITTQSVEKTIIQATKSIAGSTVESGIPSLSAAYNILYNNYSDAYSSKGCRVWSGVPVTAIQDNVTNITKMLPTYLYKNSSDVFFRYSEILYNHNWNLSSTSNTGPSGITVDATSELQVADGLYVSQGNTKAFKDYSMFIDNSLNYSSISRVNSFYQFATFCWKIPSYNQTLTKMIFYIKTPGESTYTISTDTGVVYPTNPTNSTMPLSLMYRFEDNTAPVPNGTNTTSTVWSNFNMAKTYPGINYNLKYNNEINLETPTFVASGTAGYTGTANLNAGAIGLLGFQVPVPYNVNVSTDNKMYIYCRIGIPTNSTFGFESVSLSLTS